MYSLLGSLFWGVRSFVRIVARPSNGREDTGDAENEPTYSSHHPKAHGFSQRHDGRRSLFPSPYLPKCHVSCLTASVWTTVMECCRYSTTLPAIKEIFTFFFFFLFFFILFYAIFVSTMQMYDDPQLQC